jgi:hypothetical protein
VRSWKTKNFILEQVTKAHKGGGESTDIALTTHPHLVRRSMGVGPKAGGVHKISHLPGFDPRTVQPVASRYTDWAIAAPKKYNKNGKKTMSEEQIKLLFSI